MGTPYHTRRQLGRPRTMDEPVTSVAPGKRIVFGGYECVQEIDWQTNQPVPDSWVLPGRKVLTTDEVRALAASRGWGEPIIY